MRKKELMRMKTRIKIHLFVASIHSVLSGNTQFVQTYKSRLSREAVMCGLRTRHKSFELRETMLHGK